MPQKSKVQKLKKTQRLSPFCTTNAESATTNCDPESNDQGEVFKPSSSEERKKFWLTFHWLLESYWCVMYCSFIAQVLGYKCNITFHSKSKTGNVSAMLMSDYSMC